MAEDGVTTLEDIYHQLLIVSGQVNLLLRRQQREETEIMSNIDELKAALDSATAQAAQTEGVEASALIALQAIQTQVANLTAQLENAGIPPELVAQAQALTQGLADATVPLAAAIATPPTP